MTQPTTAATVRLDAWLTVPQLARRIGWTRQRTMRALVTLNRQCGNMLLKDCANHDDPTVKPRARWIVSIARLAIVAPELVPPELPADGPQMGVHVERHGRPAALQVGRDAA